MIYRRNPEGIPDGQKAVQRKEKSQRDTYMDKKQSKKGVMTYVDAEYFWRRFI